MDWIRGPSPAARALESLLAQVAASDVSVLVQGESGAGKSALVREFHRRSARAAAPLLETQLSTLSPSLLESELFGHVAGAFTGAHRARAGRFERVGAGTLVLDGIETLAEELQAKLLRVLQERVIEPLGAEELRPFAGRVVSTSTRDLAGEVRVGRFRGDLYYRLAVVVLEVPPLRERLEDLPGFCEAILARAAARLRAPPRALSVAARERLARHSWPGNLRELENSLERVLVLGSGRGDEIESEEFGFLDDVRKAALPPLVQDFLSQGLALEEFERSLAAEALRQCRGNVSAAARALGLSRRAFERLQLRGPNEEGA